MKKYVKSAALFLAVVALAGNAYSQGTTGFANNPLRLVTTEETGGSALAGTRIGLYLTTDTGADITSLGSEVLRAVTSITTIAGVFNGGTITFNGTGGLPTIAPATPVLVEVRAWSNGGNNAGALDSYEAQVASGRGWVGTSGPLNVYTLGGGGLPTPSLTIQGQMMGFVMTPVPEPSTIALGLLGGLGAMLLLRRRK